MPPPPLDLVRRAAGLYRRLRLSRTAAALAFYGVFSLGPLLVIAFSVTGWLVGESAAEGLVTEPLREVVGAGVADTIEALLVTVDRGGTGVGASLIAGLVLFYIGSTVFFQLQAVLAEVLGAPPVEFVGWKPALWRRLRGFVMIVLISLVLTALVVLNLALAAAVERVSRVIHWLDGTQRWAFLAISTGVAVGLVAAMFRWLTAVRVPWRAVRRGAVVTTALLMAGTWGAGLYFSTLGVTSGAYAAFPLLVVLALFNFLAQALLFGAALTRVYADTGAAGPT